MRIEQGSTHEVVRRHNLSVVLRQLHLQGAFSRSELAARTELNRSTIKALVQQLASLGLVAEGEADQRGRPGRPSPMVRVRPERLAALAVEIAVDSIAVALVGLGGHVHGVRRAERADGAAGPDEIVGAVRDLAADLLTIPVPVVGVGVAIVGIVRRGDGFVHAAPNLGWTDVPLGDLVARKVVEEVIGADAAVYVANEADLGVLAEHARGAAAGADDVVYLSGEVGIGGGVIVGGRLLTGAVGYAGEIGHLPVNPGGSLCGCGSRGCWETEAGERALLRLAGVPEPGGSHAVAEVIAAAAAGERHAVRAVTHVAQWLGTGLAGLINVFNPERVVLGGLYGRAFDAFQPMLDETLRARVLPASSQVDIVPGALGADAPLVGAAELVLGPVLDRPDHLMDTMPRRYIP